MSARQISTFLGEAELNAERKGEAVDQSRSFGASMSDRWLLT